MKLIIKEYLSIIKESNELDRLIPSLLLLMNIKTLSKPQIGVRQYGVDVAAVGKDEDGEKKLFLFVIKQGDIGRVDWDSNPQSVRQSLTEIQDIYLTLHVEDKYKEMPKKIILCTGGELKQEVELNWNGYIKEKSKKDEIEFDLWNGDYLSILVEKLIFNEEVLPVEYRSYLRKTLALLDEPDYNLNDFDKLLQRLLFNENLSSLKSTSSKKKLNRTFRVINLSLNIVFSWAKKNDNLKPALLCAERTLLYSWEFIRKNNLTADNNTIKLYHDIYITYRTVLSSYFSKVYKNCFVLDGLHGYGNNAISECLNVFEQLGILSVYGLMLFYDHLFAQENEDIIQRLNVVNETIKSFVNNHQVLNSPFYDNHIIEISLAIHLLSLIGEKKFIRTWIDNIIVHVEFAYVNLGRYFPIETDSFEDLVALNISNEINKKELMKTSTLIPILAEWCLSLNFEETYKLIKQKVDESFSDCTLQIWYPSTSTIDYVFKENYGRKSGSTDAPYVLEESIIEMISKIKKVQKHTISLDEFTPFIEGGPILPFISNRHFRNPIFPLYWQMNICYS